MVEVLVDMAGEEILSLLYLPVGCFDSMTAHVASRRPLIKLRVSLQFP